MATNMGALRWRWEEDVLGFMIGYTFPSLGRALPKYILTNTQSPERTD